MRARPGRTPYTGGVFGISGSEFLVIVLVAVIVVGPQRLPEYTRKLTQMVRQLRVFLDNARSQLAEEVGPEMADLDLSSLDPRQYDPRKIVRDALGEDIDAIREDLAHPFRSVGSAAKEVSDDAAQAVNDVVTQDRAKSLSKQIEAKRAEQLVEKDGASSAADDAEKSAGSNSQENATQPQTGADVPPESQDVLEAVRGADAAEAVESTGDTEKPETSAVPQGVLQTAGGTESDDEPEPAESTDQVEYEAVESEPPEPGTEPAEVPASLVEPGSASGEHQRDASATADDSGTRVRPLSPRDIVRAANAAARTRAEVARVAVDF